jgi:hypothetical protein
MGITSKVDQNNQTGITYSKSSDDLECNVRLGWQGKDAVSDQEYDQCSQ